MLMININDISFILFDIRNKTTQFAGSVSQMCQQLNTTPRFYQAVFNNPGNHIYINITTADNSRSFIRVGNITMQHSCQSNSTGTFADHLRPLHHEQYRRRNIIVFNYKNIIMGTILVVFILVGTMLWAFLSAGGADTIAVGVMALYGVVGLAVVGGVLAALIQRLREIKRGEEEDAKKY